MSHIVKGDFSAITAAVLLPYLPEPLKPYALNFVVAGHANGLDPRFLAAISCFETGRGTSSAFRTKNNAMGTSDRNGPVYFPSVRESIDRQAVSLARPDGYYANAKTIDAIGAIYSPAGAANDPNGTNGSWAKNVTKFYEAMLPASLLGNVRVYVEPPKLERVLKKGMRGDDVKYLQALLHETGAFTGAILGNFLELTDEAVRYFQGTHIDKEGNFLKADGEVGPKTWWALHNPDGSAQRSYLDPREGTYSEIESKERIAILAFFRELHEEGVREIPDGSNYGDGVTKIVNSCGFRYGIAWCLAAQSFAEKEVTGSPLLGAMHVSCYQFWNLALEQGKAHLKKDYEPLPGDIGIYSYGTVNKQGQFFSPGHAVRVARVSEDGKAFNSYGGNEANRLKFGTRKTSEATLVGFVNPYGDEKKRPAFKKGITEAPVSELTLAGSR